MQKTILICGATGTLGQPVARALKDAGYGVRIMTRNQEKARQCFDESYEVVVGNPTDTACLEKALDGCYGVHISLSPEIEQQVAEAIKGAGKRLGIQRISYISGASVAEENRWFPMIDQKLSAEQAIKESGIPYTIFCPTWIMETLPMFVNQGQASVLGKQPCPYHWIAAEDIGRLVSTAFGTEEAANQRFVVHGPEAIRLGDALQRYCGVLHPEIKNVSNMPFWLVKVLAIVTKNQALKGAGEMMAYFEKVGEGNNPANGDGIVPAPTTTLDMWIQKKAI